ncbi:CobW family GTP-binding protein [Bacillus songklensis]|uniref:CobW family GTP-binding protein n=1 Tax=Bacillus songklensis TaxID=1069116 RepID=A0ABV8AZ76_9BACI
MKKVEIYILSGFLGSGKTTLLQQLLKQEKEKKRRIAVVMNELGQVSIDSNAIPGDTPLKELLNGCVCCTIQGQLETQIHSMLQEYELDAIYIETTGVAHPVEVLDACMSPLFAAQIDMKGIITLVDANRWKDRKQLSIRLQTLLVEQIRHADFILINKVDMLTESEQASLLYEIQSLNANAGCVLTSHASISLEAIQGRTFSLKSSHEKTHVHHHLHLKTFVYEQEKPFDLELFEDWLRRMPDTIYRMKGYLTFTHSNDLYMFQYSYGMPIYMKEVMKLPTILVLIGENLNHQQIQEQLKQLEEQSADLS